MSSASDEPLGIEAARPALRVVRGDPTPEELAALTALLAATSGKPGRPAPRVRRGGWNDPAGLHQLALLPGPNAWRAAALPR